MDWVSRGAPALVCLILKCIIYFKSSNTSELVACLFSHQAPGPILCFVLFNLLHRTFYNNLHTQDMCNVDTQMPSRWAHAMTATFPVSLILHSYPPSLAVILPSAVALSSWFKSISEHFACKTCDRVYHAESTGSFLSLPAFLQPCPFRSPLLPPLPSIIHFSYMRPRQSTPMIIQSFILAD